MMMMMMMIIIIIIIIIIIMCSQVAGARYVGFEPPGGLLSKRLSEQTASLGFLAAVCANDWIARLSVRAVQDMRERVLDALGECDRSKATDVIGTPDPNPKHLANLCF